MSRSSHLSKYLSIIFVLALLTQFFAIPGARADDPTCDTNFAHNGIAWTGNSVVLVASDNHNDGGNLYYFWQKAGSGDWNRELVAAASGGSCSGNCDYGYCPITPWGYVSNAIAWTGDSAVIAAVNQRDGGLYYWWQPSGGTGWNQQTIALGPPGCCSDYSVENGQTTPKVAGYSPPSIAWTGASVVIAACGQSNDLHYWFQKKGQGTWYHQLVAKGDCSSQEEQPSIAWTGSSVIIAANCAAGLCYYWEDAGNNAWNRQVVDQYPSSVQNSPSITWTGHDVAIAASQGNTVSYYWQAAGTRPWHKYVVASSTNDSFGPAAIAEANGSVVIAASQEGFSVPNDNGLDYWWTPATDSNSWTQQAPAPSESNYSAWSDPRSVAWTGNSVVVTSTTACGDLDYWWQARSTTNWNHQRVATNQNWPRGAC
jgi:hypothetical protein